MQAKRIVQMCKIKKVVIGDGENAPSVDLSNFASEAWGINKAEGETDKEFIGRLERDYGVFIVNEKE